MAEEISLGDLKIRLKLDDTGLDVAVADTKKKMDSLERKALDLGKKVGIGIAAAVTAVAGAVALALNRADDLSKAAQKIGVGVTELSRLEYAGRLADVSLDSLTTSIRFLNRNLVAAGEGSKEAVSAFDQLDVTFKNVDGTLRSSTDVLTDLADRFSRLEEGPRKTALAMQLFGRSGAEMIPLLNEGKAGLKALGDEAERLGLVLDTETAANAERVNDAFTRLWGSIQGLATRVAVSLLPQLTKVAELFESEDFQLAVRDWGKIIIETLNAIIGTAVAVTNAIRGINDAFADDQHLSDSGLKESLDSTARAYVEAREGYFKLLGTGISAGSAEATKAANEVQSLNERVQTLQAEMDRRKSSGMTTPTSDSGDTPFEPFKLPGLSGGTSQEELDKELEALRDSLKSKAEIVTDAFVVQQAQLEEFLDLGMITKQDYDLLTQRSEKQHWEEMKEIRKAGLSDLEKFTEMSWDQQAKTIFGELESITSGVKDQNAILFNINKGAAVANAVLNTYEGISKSLSAYPMPLAGIMAGVHAAAGFAQVSSLLATTPNTTGGSAKGLSGGGGADGATTGANVAPQSNVQYIKGIRPDDLFTGSSLRSIAEGLLQYQKDGGTVVFAE